MSIEPGKLLTTPDVLIIGGGAAGVAAAAGAAQAGATVTLIEKNGYPGGKATAAFVGTVCGLFYTSVNKAPEFVTGGFPKTFGEKLMSLSETKPEFQKGGLHYFPYDRAAFIAICNDLLNSHVNSACFHSYVENMVVRQHAVYEVGAVIHHHRVKIYPRTVIDCSGDALSSLLTNSNPLESDRYQAAAQVFVLNGLPETDTGQISLNLIRCIRKGIESSALPPAYESVSIVPGTLKNGKALFKLGIPFEVDHTEQGIAEIEFFAKEAVNKIASYLQSESEIFRHSQIEMIAPETGIRTGPRNRGKYLLTEEDVLSCKKFRNGIARGSWPVEYWQPGKRVEMTWLTDHDFYTIPSECLIAEKINNLFFAGRNISATDKAIASARVIGTCLQTGFAAGMLAAGYARGTDPDTTVQSIQQSLFNCIQA